MSLNYPRVYVSFAFASTRRNLLQLAIELPIAHAKVHNIYIELIIFQLDGLINDT